ncbi:MAG: hypothetical protein ACE15D_18930 [Candidatus Eisenbacteria bacterium]
MEQEPNKPSAIVEYSPIESGLAELRKRYEGVAFNLRTVAGNDEARKARMELVTLRGSLEKARVALKAPVLERGRLIDDEARRITAELLKLEQPIDEQIKADEKRREDEKRAREEAERQRIQTIRERISGIAKLAAAAAHLKTSAAISEAIDDLKLVVIDDWFGEFAHEAKAVKIAAYGAMQDLLEAAKEREAEAQRIAEERAELERRRQADEARLAEERRLAQEQQQAEEARLAQERARIAEEERVARERREAEEAALRQQREEQEAAARAERERIASEERRIAQEREALERAQREQAEREAAKKRRKAVAQQPAPAVPRPTADMILDVVALHFSVDRLTATTWLRELDFDALPA